MDLRSIINTEAGESSASKQPAPVTPVQSHPSQGFREYNQSHMPQASPGKHPSQDYGAQPGGPPYPSPATYQNSYPGRPPPPPPIQAPPQNDLRSPARSYSAQSPYQQTPSSTSSQYPFPHQSHHTPQSPANSHQYPQPPPPHMHQRDSYAQVNPQANPPTHLQHHNSFSQGSPAPQTPPVGIPGAPHPYLQQHPRSASSSTPTSAHSQQQYFNQFPQDSPVSATHFPPAQLPQHQRQQSQQSQHSQHSQPGTPLGPPLAQRQSSGGFAQPSSPYQQRGFPSAPFGHFQQSSPVPPPPAPLPRVPSTSSAYDSQRTSLSEHQRRSQSERERSISVSPKTRLPSQPPPRKEVTPQSENGYNSSTKRKMEDREMEIEHGSFVTQNFVDSESVKSESNGNHLNRIPSHSPQQPTQQPPKKRIRYTEPPIWAQSVRTKGLSALVNRGPPKVNGKQPIDSAQVTAMTSPASKEMNGVRHASPAARPGLSERPHASSLLGPWEESITGKKPFEQMTKLVADFLYMNVVSRDDIGELSSRGIEVEIEAKLGQLIDKDTSERLRLPVMSECVLMDTQRTTFRSSMTEFQHKKLNDFLNASVKDAHPENPNPNRGKRVQIQYLHRREIDKFYELPPALHSTLPPAVRQKLNPRHAVKVRVSYDQKTNAELAKIIKVRLIDLDIYNPAYPLDCRISINFEMRYEGDLEDLVKSTSSPDRIKDRLSYSQSHYQIDLTQVSQTTAASGAPRTEKEHELEIEVSTAAIREQGQRAARGDLNEYLSLVEGMIDNVRVLQRNVPPPAPH